MVCGGAVRLLSTDGVLGKKMWPVSSLRLRGALIIFCANSGGNCGLDTLSANRHHAFTSDCCAYPRTDILLSQNYASVQI